MGCAPTQPFQAEPTSTFGTMPGKSRPIAFDNSNNLAPVVGGPVVPVAGFVPPGGPLRAGTILVPEAEFRTRVYRPVPSNGPVVAAGGIPTIPNPAAPPIPPARAPGAPPGLPAPANAPPSAIADPHVRTMPTALGGRLELGPAAVPVERVVELSRQIDALAAQNATMQAKVRELEAGVVGRDQAVAETVRIVDAVTAEAAKARSDLQATKTRLQQVEREDVETLKAVIGALEKLFPPGRREP
jgi:hypothetical protein